MTSPEKLATARSRGAWPARGSALSFSIVGNLNQDHAVQTFDYSKYWRRSLSSAIAAREFSRIGSRQLVHEAFLCGLLSHLGCLVMARCIPDDYESVLSRGDGWPSMELEREILGFDHAQLGGAVLLAWGMPPLLQQPVVRFAPLAEWKHNALRPFSVDPASCFAVALALGDESVDDAGAADDDAYDSDCAGRYRRVDGPLLHVRTCS